MERRGWMAGEASYGHSERREMMQFVPVGARRVLEVGCNTGRFGAALRAERGGEVWGVEPNARAATQAAALLTRVIEAPFDDGVDVPDRYFDVVVFNDVLEHLVDPWGALRLAGRKLKQGGVVVASIPNLRHVDNLLHILLEQDFRYESCGVRDKTHLRFFTCRSVARLFEESGFEVKLVKGIHASWWSPSLARRLAYRLFRARLEDTKYQQYAVVASMRRE